jgi:aryl-alcohol dehydrogenase-like predicted oxidoreductase
MEYRLLGRTKLKVSAIAIGTWQLSGPLILDGKDDGYPDVGYDKAVNLIRACEDLGVNLIDSAEIYGAGEGERRIGEAIRGRRDRWILSTKFGLRRGENDERIVNSNPNIIRTCLEDSLRRLQTDYVDIYLYHSPPNNDLVDEGREVLEVLKQEGKLRFYGISTNNEALLRQLVEKNTVDVVMFSQSLVTHPSKILDLVKEHNLGSLIRGAFQGGLLSGKYFHRRPSFAKEDIRRFSMSKLKTEQYAVFEKYIPESSSMVALALRYLLDFDTTHSIVLGAKDIADYQNALQAFELHPLDQETHIALERLGQELQRFYSRSQFKQKAIGKIKRLFTGYDQS